MEGFGGGKKEKKTAVKTFFTPQIIATVEYQPVYIREIVYIEECIRADGILATEQLLLNQDLNRRGCGSFTFPSSLLAKVVWWHVSVNVISVCSGLNLWGDLFYCIVLFNSSKWSFMEPHSNRSRSLHTHTHRTLFVCVNGQPLTRLGPSFK